MNQSIGLKSSSWEFENPMDFQPFWFEKLEYDYWKVFAFVNWKLPFIVSAFYLAIIFGIKYFMEKRKNAYKLRSLLIVWNVGLGLFSILGFFRVAPEFFQVLSSENGFHKSVCVREGLNPPMAAWGVFFALSKYVELGDTLWIVLRSQPLIFLQWYHHCVSMILAWVVLPYSEPISRYYIFMNLGVHGIMYPYFALKAMKIYIPRRLSMMLTSLQLLQMVVGVSVNLYSVGVLYTGRECARDPISIKWIGGIYGSFLVLFANFLHNTYFSKNKKA